MTFSLQNKKLWRELIGASLRASDGSWAKIEGNQKMFTKYIRRLLVHYVTAGTLSERLSPSVVVDIVYAIHAQSFREFCAIAAYTPEDILRLTRRRVRHLLTDWRGRHGQEGRPQRRPQKGIAVE